ncbi:MAG: aldehyde dehydrogenase family protein [Opitutales bacterium]|nr:aldehyde dehydrogenase family protein [Opitutales bacterium]
MNERLPVLKTYKLFIGGKFPRTESGRARALKGKAGRLIANVSLASRKDFRNAVVAARAAFPGWSGATAYLRGQILYRAAEMLEGRAAQFADELNAQGTPPARARREVADAIDLLVHYAGWTDKFPALFSTVNPVASAHFNFSVPEPTGIVAVIAPPAPGLLGFIAAIAPVIAGGNTAVALASPDFPLSAISLAEVLHDSDLPGGVVNILTGDLAELLPHLSTHMDVNGIAAHGQSDETHRLLRENAALNIKRLALHPATNLSGDPYKILAFQETKTTWHPTHLR